MSTITITNSINSSFPSETLAKEFHGFKIYATCAIAVYLCDSIIHIRKDWIWYSKKAWSAFSVISFLLEKVSSIAYIISVLLFLYLHAQSCGSLETLSLSYYAIGIGIQCLILLSILRANYSNSTSLIILLCLIALATCILHAANIFEFGEFTVGNDGNCYQEGEQTQQPGINVAFVMMMIFSWITLGLISIRSYRNRTWNTQRWRSILFGDGLLYLMMNALSQLINAAFILSKQSYIIRFANATPAFLVTSVCCQRLLMVGVRSTRHHSSIIQPTTLPSFHQDNSNPVLPLEMQQNDELSVINNNNAPEFPQPTVHRPHHLIFQTSQSPTSIMIAPPTPIISSEFSSSLISIFNNYTTMNNNTLNNHLHNSLRGSLQSFSRNSSTTKSRHSSTLSSHQNRETGSESRSSSLQANSNPQIQIRNSRESRLSSRSILSMIQNVLRNNRENRENRRRDEVDPNDIYHFRYSNAEDDDDDDDIYVFPRIPARSTTRME